MAADIHMSTATPSHPTSSHNFRSLRDGPKGCKSRFQTWAPFTGGGSQTLFISQLLLRLRTKVPTKPLTPATQGVPHPPSVAGPGSWQQSRQHISTITHPADALHHSRAVPQAPGSASPAPELTATDSSSARQAQAVIFWHFTSQKGKILPIKCSPVAKAGATLGMTPSAEQLSHRAGLREPPDARDLCKR